MKKILAVTTLLSLAFLTSCANNADEFVSLNAYNDVYVEINDDAQKEIEKAYQRIYNELKINSNNIDELDETETRFR